MRIRLADGFGPDDLARALEAHRHCFAGGAGRVLKNGGRTRISWVSLPGGRELCVKEYLSLPFARRIEDLLRPAAPLREWRAANALPPLGVGAPRAHALALPAPLRAGSAFVVLDAIAGEPVNRFAARRFARGRERAVKLRFLTGLADHLGALHARGVRHGDLKGSNLLVTERADGFEFWLVDLARVRVGAPVSRRRRLAGLAQLDASMPLVITRSDRMRFLLRYAAQESRDGIRSMFREVDRLSRARSRVWDRSYAGSELGPTELGR